MGMSASQARLIALTARMNDIEYQGQQINQQRTTLSSQINDLYNQLLDMSVPTPPSTNDFIKTVYVGGQNSLSKFTLGTVVPQGRGEDGNNKYSIDFNFTQSGYAMEKSTRQAVVKHTPQTLKFTQIDGNDIDVITTQQTKKAENADDGLKQQIKNYFDNPAEDNTNKDVDILVKMSYNECEELGLTTHNLYVGNNTDQLLQADSERLSSGDVYVSLNISEIYGNEELEKLCGITKNEDGSYAFDTLENVYSVTAGEPIYSSALSDDQIASGEYYTVGEGNVAVKITTQKGLLEALNNGKLYRRDNSGDEEFGNPAWNKDTAEYSVGDQPLLALESNEAQEKLGESYDSYVTALKHSAKAMGYTGDINKENDLLAAFYVYFRKTGSGEAEPCFILKSSIKTLQNPESTQNVNVYNYAKDGTYTEAKNYENCELEFDSATGRITRVGYPDTNTGELIWEDLKVTTEKDTEAYEDAFNEYEYQKMLYDKEQQKINAKTSIIQAEDKNLELKLTRLDNERNAVNTEIEAVKKVIQDDIESSFKTFSG